MPQPNNRQDEWNAEDGRDSRQRIKYMVEVAVKQAMEEHEVKVRQHLDSRFDELKSIMLSAFPGKLPCKTQRIPSEANRLYEREDCTLERDSL